MKLTLTYLGNDDFDLPVYKDKFGKLWKDIEPNLNAGPVLCTTVGNEFDGEPNIPMHYLKKYADAQVYLDKNELFGTENNIRRKI